MRLLMLIVPLVLALPAPLCGQSAEPDPVQEEIVTSRLDEGAPSERADPAMDGAASESVPAPAVSRYSSGSTAAAQPTMRNFLYQVFLAAVTALVTALVWKAVF